MLYYNYHILHTCVFFVAGCECNGHATACSFNETLFELSNGVSGGMCTDCSDNTAGHKCDECAEEFYPNLILPVSSINYCQGNNNDIQMNTFIR